MVLPFMALGGCAAMVEIQRRPDVDLDQSEGIHLMDSGLCLTHVKRNRTCDNPSHLPVRARRKNGRIP
jgi:hypothetical protein